MDEPLDVALNPAASISDSHKWIVIKEGQRNWIYRLEHKDPEPPYIKEDRKDPDIKKEQEDLKPPHIKEEKEDPDIKEEQEDPEPPHIKEEQEELWIRREGEQLQGLEEADIKFPFAAVSSEDDEEESQFSQSSQTENREAELLKTESDPVLYNQLQMRLHHVLEALATGDNNALVPKQ
ncbi:triadin-like [Clinocottus analis]|uniref:triadin-like n=1 Tax=Clinocottus analis TaxID=304258 RepID=UPI0035C129AA